MTESPHTGISTSEMIGVTLITSPCFIIDREVREIMYLVASVCTSLSSLMAELFRGSALTSAVKSNKNHYQSKVFICVPIISGHIRMIARMRSIGF